VLPELGERSVSSFVFGDLIGAVLGGGIDVESKFDELEAIVRGSVDRYEAQYTTSADFAERVKSYAESIEPDFRDVFYLGTKLFDSAELSELFGKLDKGAPLAVRLQKIEELIFEKVHKLRPARIRDLERQAVQMPEHAMEVKEYARMVSIAESTELITEIREFTRLDYVSLYFDMLGATPSFPLSFRDATGVTLLKLLLEPCRLLGDIRHVVVDEVQDYDAVHFEILKRLFPTARYTVLGDINQTIGKRADMDLYTTIEKILNAQKPELVTLTRSFRSTKEICEFSANLIGREIESFGRNGATPTITRCALESEYIAAIANEIELCKGLDYGSIALICNSAHSASELYARFNGAADVRLLSGVSYNVKGAFVVTAYMAKGLEFDAVLVCAPGEFDANSLFVACTRALHRLNLFEKGDCTNG
jgi:DNA helicase-2/ATP-dependent DNA helicase PcrA